MVGKADKHESVSVVWPLPIIRSLQRTPYIFTEYCQFPENQLTGSEGLSRDNGKYTLTTVVLVTRHGERSAIMTSSKSDTTIKRNTDCSLRTASHDQEWIDMFSAYKHFNLKPANHKVDRVYKLDNDTLVKGVPEVPHDTDCADAMMTALGAVQHIQLGRYLRDKYNEAFPKFPRFHMTSTAFPRAYQTARALLYGWLPTGWTPEIKFNIVPHTEQHFCDVLSDPFCGHCIRTRHNLINMRYDQRVNHWKKNCHANNWCARFDRLKDQFVRLPENGGDTIETMDYFCGQYICRRQLLPCASGKHCVTWTDMTELYEMIKTREYELSKTKDVRRRSVIESQPILDDILGLITGQLSSTPTIRIFSGHDVTVSPLLEVFGLFDGYVPHYRTRFLFEFYRSPTQTGSSSFPTEYFRLVWNGRDVTRKLAFCAQDSVQVERWSKYLCRTQKLLNFIKKDLYNHAAAVVMNNTGTMKHPVHQFCDKN